MFPWFRDTWTWFISAKIKQVIKVTKFAFNINIFDYGFFSLNKENLNNTLNWAYLATSRSKIHPVSEPFSSIFTLLKFFLNFFASSAGPLKVPLTSRAFRSSVVGEIGNEGKSPATLLISQAFTPSAQASCAVSRMVKYENFLINRKILSTSLYVGYKWQSRASRPSSLIDPSSCFAKCAWTREIVAGDKKQ